jgi:DNA-directed RNA polymerase subunit RPC12/RpoP
MKEYRFYRCVACTRVISPVDIQEHGSCPYCFGRRIRPTNLTWWEKLRELVRHPLFWRWPHV